jgi:hypothetical protein
VITSPAIAAFDVFLVIWTLSFTVGAMYLGGGSEAIRRQVPRLAVLAVVLVAVVFAIPVLMSTLGDLAWALVVVGLNAALLVAWVYQSRRGEGPLAVERKRAAFRVPAFRTLVIVWVGALASGTILAILAAKAGY